MKAKQTMGRKDIDDLVATIGTCLEEAGIEAQHHDDVGFTGLTALAQHRDGSDVRIIVSISTGEAPVTAEFGVASQRMIDSRDVSVPTLNPATEGRVRVSGGMPSGAAEIQDDTEASLD